MIKLAIFIHSFISRYVKKIEKLQFQLEELMYEKDKIAYQWANAQKVQQHAKRGAAVVETPHSRQTPSLNSCL